MRHPRSIPTGFDLDPSQAPLAIVVAVGVVVLAMVLWRDYLGLVRETLLADPSAPGMAEKLGRMAEADAALRATLGARPSWERELEARATRDVSTEG